MAPNWPIPAAIAGSRRTATRVTRGAISLSSSSHFAAQAVFELDKSGGVAARPCQDLRRSRRRPDRTVPEHDRHGAGRLLQRPPRAAAPMARMTSGARAATNSAAYLRCRSVDRPRSSEYSICTLRPSVQPNSVQSLHECRECGAVAFRIVRGQAMSTPMRRIRSACCARAASGHAAAAPPSSVMNSRRSHSITSSARREQHRRHRRGRASWRSAG